MYKDRSSEVMVQLHEGQIIKKCSLQDNEQITQVMVKHVIEPYRVSQLAFVTTHQTCGPYGLNAPPFVFTDKNTAEGHQLLYANAAAQIDGFTNLELQFDYDCDVI